MPHIIVTTAFKFAHRGVEVEQFDPSDQPRETTEEVAAWVCEHGHGHLAAGNAPAPAGQAQEKADPAGKRSRKVIAAAPENKAA